MTSKKNTITLAKTVLAGDNYTIIEKGEILTKLYDMNMSFNKISAIVGLDVNLVCRYVNLFKNQKRLRPLCNKYRVPIEALRDCSTLPIEKIENIILQSKRKKLSPTKVNINKIKSQIMNPYHVKNEFNKLLDDFMERSRLIKSELTNDMLDFISREKIKVAYDEMKHYHDKFYKPLEIKVKDVEE